MTIYRIPLAAVPSQTLSVQLGDQPCAINVYQRSTGLFLDLYVMGDPIALGVLCLNDVGLIRSIAFTGELSFHDTAGSDDPDYTGLAQRFQLLWH